MFDKESVGVSPTEREARIEVICEALRDQFGADSMAVAKRQLLAAEGEVQETWREIVARLEQ